jgi:hypothetical protein
MSRPGIPGTRVPAFGGEHSRKEPFEQLVNSYAEHLHMSPPQYQRKGFREARENIGIILSDLGEFLVLVNEGHDLALCDPGPARHAAQARRLPLKCFPKQGGKCRNFTFHVDGKQQETRCPKGSII